MKSIRRRQLALAALAMLISSPLELLAGEPDGSSIQAKTKDAKEAPGKQPNHGEGFLIGFAMNDFVTERREAGDGKAGPIDKVALHGLCWFPPKESSDGMYFMGHVSLDTPITPAQYRILMTVRKKHGSEQVYFKNCPGNGCEQSAGRGWRQMAHFPFSAKIQMPFISHSQTADSLPA